MYEYITTMMVTASTMVTATQHVLSSGQNQLTSGCMRNPRILCAQKQTVTLTFK